MLSLDKGGGNHTMLQLEILDMLMRRISKVLTLKEVAEPTKHRAQIL